MKRKVFKLTSTCVSSSSVSQPVIFPTVFCVRHSLRSDSTVSEHRESVSVWSAQECEIFFCLNRKDVSDWPEKQLEANKEGTTLKQSVILFFILLVQTDFVFLSPGFDRWSPVLNPMWKNVKRDNQPWMMLPSVCVSQSDLLFKKDK